MSRVTLKMIAKEAGMTTATVSMALRHHPAISPATRDRIQSIASRLGYQSNPHISALMTHVRKGRSVNLSSNIAMLHTFPGLAQWDTNEPTRRLVKGVRTRCKELGFGSDMLWLYEKGMSPSRLTSILRTRGVRGIILIPWPQHTVNLELDWSGFASATINYNIVTPPLHRAAEDFFGNVGLAYQEFIHRGCRRIGFVCKAYHEPESQHRLLAAYLRWQSLYSDHSGPPPLLLENWNKADVLSWYKKELPDAIITLDWDIGRWLPQEGIQVPGDVSVALLNQCPNYGHFSGIDPNYEHLGSAAVDLVVEQIYNNDFGLPQYPKEVLIHGLWAEGTMVRSSP